VHYDLRFEKRVNGLGFSVGAGFFGESGISVFSIPISLNYIVGRSSHFFEIAGGTTFITAAATDFFDVGTDKTSGFIFHINAGYQYQPSRGGFFFRGGISSLFFEGEYATSYYTGVGHNF
jgi:hypothetical protein